MSSAENGGSTPVSDSLGRHTDRRARLAAQRSRGRLRHLHIFGRVEDVDVEGAGTGMSREFPLDEPLISDEQESDLQMPCGDERPADDRAGAVIAAHGVDGDTQQRLLCFLDGLDLASLVVAAVRTDLVRRFRFLALGTSADRHGLQGVMSAALRRPGLRMPPFWIRHDCSLKLLLTK